MKNKKIKILVLGGCGFIGSHLVNKLVKEGYEVRVFDRLNASVENIINVIDKVDLVYGDFSNEWDLKKAMDGCDIVYHLISTTFPGSTIQSGIYDTKSNLIPSIKILELAIQYNITHLLYLSSGGTVYGNQKDFPILETNTAEPITLYGLSKLTIENYIKLYCNNNKVKFTILRASNVYGPRQNIYGIQGLIAVAIGNIIRGKPIEIWGDGNIYRDYIYIDDLISGLYIAINKQPMNQIYNIASEEMYSINEIIHLIEKITRRSFKIIYKPHRKVDVKKNILAIGKIKKDFNWQPCINIEEGIKRTWDWALKTYQI